MEKVKILWSGITGRVAKEAVRLSTLRPDVEIVAGISRAGDTYHYNEIHPELHTSDDLKVYDFIESFDVIVDFSHPDAFDAVSKFALKVRKPLILGTKGLSLEQRIEVENLAKKIPVFFNDDMGIAELDKLAAKIFDTAVFMKSAKAGEVYTVSNPSVRTERSMPSKLPPKK